MRFLFPGFLFALLTIVIPILIHLFNFRKFKKVYFSNVRFLKNVEMQSSAHRQLKDRLILATRILGIIFLVLAFAQPYIPSDEKNNNAQKQLVSIFLDNSFSMEVQNMEGSLLEEAKRRAKEIVSAYSLNDKFQILTNDFEGKDQRLLSSEEFINAVDAIEISPTPKNINQIISRQRDIFTKEPNARKAIYVISDFQENLLTQKAFVVDSTETIRFIRLKANPQPNISIDSVWFNSAIHRPGQIEKLVFRLKNNSDEEVPNVPVKLWINGEQKALGTLSIKARSSATDTLTFSALKSGWQQAMIEITDYPLVFDNKFYFSFKVDESMPVLIINANKENAYLNALFNSDTFFNQINTNSGNVNYSELANYPIIILNELPEISEGLIQQLQEYCKRGGHLMIFPYLSQDQSDLKQLLKGLNTDLPLELVRREERVNSINFKHPIFQGVFEKENLKIDLPLVKSYLKFTSLTKTNRKNILSFAGNELFFSEYNVASGKVYLSAVAPNTESSNFVEHALFVPIMYQSVLQSLRAQRIFYDLNKEQLINLPKIVLSQNQTLKLKKDEKEWIVDLKQNEHLSQIILADQVEQSGNYELFKGDSLISVLSFNDAGTESDLSYAGNKQINANFEAKKPEIMDAEAGSIENKIKSINQGIALWKVCLILALIFFALEVLLIRYYNKIQIKPQIN